MESPLVTVYIVNHNYGRYLKQAIESAINQNYDSFEIVIIDDGSSDNSESILKHYEVYKKIKVVRQNNKGLNVSNNIALKISNGKYIMRLDADDYLEYNALKYLTKPLEIDPDLALVFPDYYEVDDLGNVIKIVQRNNFQKEVTLFDLPAHGACTMFRKKLVELSGGYDENFSRQDGYDMWLNLAHSYKIGNINKPLFFYRKHAKSLSSHEIKLLETRAQILKKHVKKRGVKPLNVVGIIPIRGQEIDTRSLPLKTFSGKPLVDWTIDSALNCAELKKLIVTTPDKLTIDHVIKKYKNSVDIHIRKPQLARINSSISETVAEILEIEKNNDNIPDALMLLDIGSPFRTEMYISKAINVMQIFSVDSVMAVRMDDDLFYNHDGTGLKPRISNEKFRLERDEMYRQVGGLTLVKIQYFNRTRKLVGGCIGHILMDQRSAFTIQTDLDYKIASAIANS